MAEFFHMGGYAAYVWSSYGLAFIVLFLSIVAPMRENKALIRQLKGKSKREQALAEQRSALQEPELQADSQK